MKSAGDISKNAANRKTSKLDRAIASSFEQQTPDRQLLQTSFASLNSCLSCFVGYLRNAPTFKTGSCLRFISFAEVILIATLYRVMAFSLPTLRNFLSVIDVKPASVAAVILNPTQAMIESNPLESRLPENG